MAPGITIRDRLRVLLANDPERYYRHRELLPTDLPSDNDRAKIVLTNYHPFKLRERLEVSTVGRSLLQGHGPALETIETEGQMLQRVMPELMGLKNVVVLNDEAHHSCREKVAGVDGVTIDAPKGKDADTIPGGDMRKFHDLRDHIGKRMPKEGRGTSTRTLATHPTSRPTCRPR